MAIPGCQHQTTTVLKLSCRYFCKAWSLDFHHVSALIKVAKMSMLQPICFLASSVVPVEVVWSQVCIVNTVIIYSLLIVLLDIFLIWSNFEIFKWFFTCYRIFYQVKKGHTTNALSGCGEMCSVVVSVYFMDSFWQWRKKGFLTEIMTHIYGACIMSFVWIKSSLSVNKEFKLNFQILH